MVLRSTITGLASVVLVCTLIMSLAILAFTATGAFYLALPSVFVAGAMMTITGTGAQTLIQAAVDARMSGRVMALAVLGLTGEFETDAVGVVEVDAKQSRKLRNRPDIVDAMRLQPRLDLAEAFGRDDKGAVLHGADGIAVARRLLPFGNLEEGEKAVIAHIEK
jgi:hypothetical protein